MRILLGTAAFFVALATATPASATAIAGGLESAAESVPLRTFSLSEQTAATGYRWLAVYTDLSRPAPATADRRGRPPTLDLRGAPGGARVIELFDFPATAIVSMLAAAVTLVVAAALPYDSRSR
jgi:hypothetical protein